jgi:hypothetical protein
MPQALARLVLGSIVFMGAFDAWSAGAIVVATHTAFGTAAVGLVVHATPNRPALRDRSLRETPG